MNTMLRMLLITCLILPFAACKKEEAPKVEAVAAPLSAPTNDDLPAWRAYVTDVAKRNMDGITNSPYVYFLPSEGTEGVGGQQSRPRFGVRRVGRTDRIRVLKVPELTRVAVLQTTVLEQGAHAAVHEHGTVRTQQRREPVHRPNPSR